MNAFRLDSWVVDPSDGTLTSSSGATRLEPKVMALLVVLAEHQGSVVTREVLLREVWRDTHVAPGALARAVSILRRALEDDPRAPRFIETIAKRGYRLLPPVVAVERHAATAPADDPDPRRPLPLASPAAASVVGSRRTLWVAAAIALAVVIAQAFWGPRETGSGKAAPSRRATNDTRAGNESAFLYYTRAVAADPHSADAHAGLATAYAFRANYLDRAEWSRVAIATARRAVALDSTSASAEKALATAYLMAGRYATAIQHYRRAFTLFADSGIASNLGLALMTSGRVADALPLFEQRVLDAPEQVTGYAQLAEALTVGGYEAESTAMAHAALRIEPYAFTPQMTLVRHDLLAARYDEARLRLERLLEVYPACTQCVVQLGLIAQLTGDAASAEAQYRDAQETSAAFAPAALRLAQMLMQSRRLADAESLLAGVEDTARAAIARGGEAPAPRWSLAAAAAIRGDTSAAAGWYGEAVALGRRDATWDRWDPLLAPLRSMSAFRALEDSFSAERTAATPFVRRLASPGRRSRPIPALLARPGELSPDPPGWPLR